MKSRRDPSGALDLAGQNPSLAAPTVAPLGGARAIVAIAHCSPGCSLRRKSMPSFPIVGSHVHLYDPTILHYPWIADVPALLRPHLLPDLDKAAGPVEVMHAVFVGVDAEAGLKVREAAWVSEQSATEPRIA